MSVLPFFQVLAFISKVNYFNIPIWNRGALSLCCDYIIDPLQRKSFCWLNYYWKGWKQELEICSVFSPVSSFLTGFGFWWVQLSSSVCLLRFIVWITWLCCVRKASMPWRSLAGPAWLQAAGLYIRLWGTGVASFGLWYLEPTHTTVAFLDSKCYLQAIVNIKWQGQSQARLPAEWDVCCRTGQHSAGQAVAERWVAAGPLPQGKWQSCNILRNVIGRQRWANLIFPEGSSGTWTDNSASRYPAFWPTLSGVRQRKRLRQLWCLGRADTRLLQVQVPHFTDSQDDWKDREQETDLEQDASSPPCMLALK